MTYSRVASPRTRGALPLGFISLREDPRSRPWRDTSGGIHTVLLTALSLIEALSYHVRMRYVVTLFLGALLVIVGGLSLDYFSLDFSAPEDGQLTATGVLAYYDCYYEGDCEWETNDAPMDPIYTDPLDDADDYVYEEPWYVFPEDQDMPPPPPDEWWYMEERDPVYVIDDIEEPFYGYEIEEPFYDIEGPYYMDEVRDPYAYGDVVVYEEPWYVEAFPGIGKMAQQIIPGAQQTSMVIMQPAASVRAPAPVPAPQQPPRPIYPQPSCWVSAQPVTVPYGGSSVLQWGTFNASRASFNDVGAVPTYGSRTVSSVSSDRTFMLTVVGQGGSGSCYTRVSVDRGNSALPSCVISAHPRAISRGQSASLAWVSSNAQSATLSGIGAVSTTGGTFVSPQTSTTYTLTVRDSLGRTGTCAAQISVSQ